MRWNSFLSKSFWLLLVLGLSSAANAKEVRPEWEASLLDDSTLHDVTFVGRQGWAVGEHGVIRRTTDGGRSWSLEQAPKSASLRSVCFLTNRLGWMAGGYVEPYTQAARGVLFVTSNGGESWTELSGGKLPYLHTVKFFSLEDGIAVGRKLGPYGSGLLMTHDGGQTWEDVSAVGELEAEWRTGDFLSPERGVFAGRRGSLVIWGGDQVRENQQMSIGRATIRDVHLDSNGSGWLVGEQALLLRTSNAGVAWASPAGRLPSELRDVTDFLAVTQRGDQVWVAGKPGTIIWHSPDGGRSWQRQFTGETLPIRALHFRDEQHGVAIGDMGLILTTDNGGTTWSNAQQEQKRRAGLMLITARPEQISFPLLAWYAGENGYRSVALVPVEQETERAALTADLRLSASIASAGGNTAIVGTRLPVGLPDLASNREELIAEWNNRTDGRLTEVLLGGLVAEIRQWRPEVIVLPHAADHDQTTQLLNQAVLEAVDQAGDATRHLDLVQGLGLRPWKVPRAVTLEPASGPTRSFFSPRRPLVRMGLTLEEATLAAQTRVLAQDVAASGYGSLKLAESDTVLQMTELFQQLDVPAGGAARRRLIPMTTEMLGDLDRDRNRPEQVKAMAASARQRHGSAQTILAILDQQLAQMDDEEAARLLYEMGEEEIALGEWMAAEGLLIQLVNRYQKTLAGQAGAKRLIQIWASDEISWLRSRGIGSKEGVLTLDQAATEKLLATPQQKIFSSKIYEGMDEKDDAPFISIVQTSAKSGARPWDWQSGVRATWLSQAGTLGVLMSKENPGLFRDEIVQRSLAVVNRQPQLAADLDALYQRVHGLQKGVPTNWFLPLREPTIKKTLAAQPVKTRPELDGQLTDACWKEAAPQVLEQGSGRLFANGASIVMLAYDKEYLYLAASVVKHPDVQYEGPQPAGRRHDENLTGHDRLSFFIDIDRDYGLFYELTIDERGLTAETVGGGSIWNPEMFLAAKHDGEHWRLEAAVPLRELAPPERRQGDSWGLAMRRTIPAVGWESWQGEATTDKPGVAEFGRLQLR